MEISSFPDGFHNLGVDGDYLELDSLLWRAEYGCRVRKFHFLRYLAETKKFQVSAICVFATISTARGPLSPPLATAILSWLSVRVYQHALRNTVKKSLQQLSRAINGDAKTEPQTLFKASIENFVAQSCGDWPIEAT